MADPHDIARAMVALPGWRWLGGARRLRWAPGKRDHLQPESRVPDTSDGWDYDAWPVVPDITDAATLGCVEHGLLAPAGVWVERIRVGVDTYSWRACDPCGPLPMVGARRAWRDSLPEALLDGLRAVAS